MRASADLNQARESSSSAGSAESKSAWSTCLDALLLKRSTISGAGGKARYIWNYGDVLAMADHLAVRGRLDERFWDAYFDKIRSMLEDQDVSR